MKEFTVEIESSSNRRGAGEVQVLRGGKGRRGSQRVRESLSWRPPNRDQKGEAYNKYLMRGVTLQSVTKCLLVGWGLCWSAGSLIGKTMG